MVSGRNFFNSAEVMLGCVVACKMGGLMSSAGRSETAAVLLLPLLLLKKLMIWGYPNGGSRRDLRGHGRNELGRHVAAGECVGEIAGGYR